MSTTETTRRRRYRYSLRTSLVIITLVCCWLATTSARARKQSKAIQRIEELGGHIGFDYQLDGNRRWKKDPTLPAPKWLSKFVGEDYFRTVVIVNFDEGSDPSNDDLAVVEELRDLRELTLFNRTIITDAGLEHLAMLTSLRVLALSGTNVNGEGFVHLQHMRNLKGLSASDTPLSDTGLQLVKELPKIDWLFINDTNITDIGLEHISNMESLKSLEVSGTQITDDGIAGLQTALPACKVSW